MIIMLVGNQKQFGYGNQRVYHNAFRDFGRRVLMGDVNAVEILNGRARVPCVEIADHIESGKVYESKSEMVDFANADFAWLMEHPHPSLERDVFQVLWVANQQCKFVNPIDKMFFCNNKNVLSEIFPQNSIAGTIVTNNPDTIHDQASADRRWVVKPSNEGNGQDVFVLQPGDTNRNVIIHSITGNAAPKYETYKKEQIGLQSRYAVCQPFIEEAVRDERRLMFVGGELIGCYGTVKNENDHRANRIHGTRKVSVELSADELSLANNVGNSLRALDINYAAIDYAAGQVLEANMVTPGGIQLLAEIQGAHVIEGAARKLLSVMAS